MIPMLLLAVILIYAVTIASLIYGFSKINSFEYSGLAPKTKFTIIVPFRDETENLPLLLESFSKLNYPMELFKVILVDDASHERGQSTDYGFEILLIPNNRVSKSPKKDAIRSAVPLVKTEWIITTDADCSVPKNWLLTLDNYIQCHPVSMIAGPVTYDCTASFLHHFQQLDLASLQGATMGSFGLRKGFMCNGANFAYTRSLFEKLKGFEGNDTIASGDDVFLLQKAMAQFPEKVHYLKSENNIVRTKPQNDWKSLLDQRVRWASKTASYKSSFGIGLGLVVFLGNLSWLLSLGFWVLGYNSLLEMAFILLLKWGVDGVLIYKSNVFLTKNKMRYLVLSSCIYPFFSTAVAVYSWFGKYEWKGRTF